ncbi:MAG: heavy metal-responsive transcriptional regulator [Gammaproteobacteria bacterium]
MKPLTIGQVAQRAGISVEAIRYYEKQELLAKPVRNASGYRQYSLEAVRRLRFIQRAKDLGFTLREVRELLALRAEPGVSCADVRQQATDKITGIDQKLRRLTQMRDALQTLADECDTKTPLSECPILEALEREEERQGDTD